MAAEPAAQSPRILVASDFSQPAEAALEAGIRLAKSRGGSLDIVHVFSYPTPLAAPYDVALPPSYLKDTTALAEKSLDELAARARESGLRVATHIASQPTIDGIVRVAREIGAETIVVGTHGHTGIKHALLGSVAERIVRHAPCEVLVARVPAQSE